MKPAEKEFIAESEEILDNAVNCLLKIEESPLSNVNPSLVNALFRDIHTLKGMSGLYDHPDITDISHSLENLLDDVRLGKIAMNDEVVTFVLRFIDLLKSQVNRLKGGRGKKHRDVSEYVDEIEAFRESVLKSESQANLNGLVPNNILKVLSEYEEHRLRNNLSEGRGVYFIKTFYDIEDFDIKLKKLSGKLKTFGEQISTMPTSGKVPEGKIGFDLMICSEKTSAELERELDCEVRELVPPKRITSQGRDIGGDTTLKTATTTVRVDIDKLDTILNTIAELSLAEGSLQRLWSVLTETYGHLPHLVDLYKVDQILQRRLAELQDQVLEIRMVPVGQIFNRLGQVIRRYSRKVNKDLDLKVFGEDTEIDKFLAEEVIDPLIHIVRNAIDHGIETEGERESAGKGRIGNVTLRAFQRGNNVVVEVEDDGRGIDLESIKGKAIEKGLIEPNNEPGERELIDFMFFPGFTTSETVSEVSGRGVGLDIVKDKISSLGGFVEVVSEKGIGSRFILTLPITLAIVKALVVRVGEEKYAIPLSAMSETFMVDRALVQNVEKRKVYNLREEMLPLTSLSDFLRRPAVEIDRSFAVVVGFGDRKMGLLVDELMGKQSVVIKSLGGYFEDLRGFAGAAEVGEHEVILVLDVESIVEESLPEKGPANV